MRSAGRRAYRAGAALRGRGSNELSELLEVGAHGVTAILATWLGLLVLTRAGRAHGAPVFSFLCLLLVTWSLAIIAQRLGTEPGVHGLLNLLEDASAFLLPPVTTHLAIAVALEGGRSRFATTVLAAGYTIAALAILQAAVDPANAIGFAEGSWSPMGIPGPVIGWGFALIRAAVWLVGIGYLVEGLRRAGADDARRRQLQVGVATVVLGVIGGMMRIVPPEIGGPRWIGVSIVTIATIMATYAILAQHLFLAADVAGRAVRWTVGAGLGVVLFVGVLVALDRLAAEIIGLDVPIVTALAIVVTLAVFDPVAEWVRDRVARGPRGADRARLVQAIGGELLFSQQPDRALEPALARIIRTFALTGVDVLAADGTTRATAGTVDPDDPLALRLPMTDASGVPGGQVVFGRKVSGLSFTASDVEALELAVEYLGASLRLADRQETQVGALADLRAEQTAVTSRGTALTEALAEAASSRDGLRVFALGSLRAERGGDLVRQWGGEKAGSRQAEAVFAFLFDRGERGATKDEILELVWPDVDLDRADVAFHRTLLGLRSVLQPGRRSRGASAAIAFHHDRYRIDPSIIAWSDVGEFEQLLGAADITHGAEVDGGVPGRIRRLERAVAVPRRLPRRLPVLRGQRPRRGATDGAASSLCRPAHRARGAVCQSRRPIGRRELLRRGPVRRRRGGPRHRRGAGTPHCRAARRGSVIVARKSGDKRAADTIDPWIRRPSWPD